NPTNKFVLGFTQPTFWVSHNLQNGFMLGFTQPTRLGFRKRKASPRVTEDKYNVNTVGSDLC
ncbi:MAG: hypothetical protein P5702_24940, partial [Limnospira sp. PMC 1291.21]|nr:hypothetical protein [Limnospira sp. PMC 1279.21]MDT9267539.1 hypothetical protein [Limnospira sp. PMC 1223.20]MDT9308464.1 hypothetical protein [Limnospira sp. PMC 1291.21]MDT9323785.1 hypothetical protein [Limnospira sp. PMC 1290.21]